MTAPTLSPSSFGWERWAVSIAVITLIGILQALPAALSGEGIAVVPRVVGGLLVVPLFMVPLFASFNWASRRRMRSGLTILMSLAVAITVGAVDSAATWWVVNRFPGFFPPQPHPPTLPRILGIGVGISIGLCAVWALAFVVPFAAEDARIRAMEAEKLKLEASTLRVAAELARLRSQLEPHFILNTLNAIAGLTTSDPREARRLIACLGDLLRDSLRDAGETQTLGEEVAWLRRYAEILESRHAGSLRFHWEIDASAAAAVLPRLLLQPLVENAVKHGALRRDGGGEVWIRASVTPQDGASSQLRCVIEDNGPGLPESPARAGALGLRAVRRRIELEPGDGSLELHSSSEGTRAVVVLSHTTRRDAHDLAEARA